MTEPCLQAYILFVSGELRSGYILKIHTVLPGGCSIQTLNSQYTALTVDSTVKALLTHLLCYSVMIRLPLKRSTNKLASYSFASNTT